MTLESVYQGPKRGADRAVLLAHGAGADMNAVALTTVADALAAAKIPSLRFNFPYMSAGRGGPDRPPVLAAAVREAAADLAKRAKLPSERLVLGGRSMGGRICSLVVAERRRRTARARSGTARLSAAPTGQARSAPGRALPAGAGPVPLREWHPGRVRHPRRTQAPRQEDQGQGVLALDRHRRPRLQTTEGEWDHPAGCARGRSRCDRRLRRRAPG